MNQLWLTTLREYLHIVKRKGFVIGTILTPLFLFATIFLPAILAERDNQKSTITVIDRTGKLIDDFKKELANEKVPDGSEKYTVNEGQDDEAAIKNTRASIEKKELRALVIIPADYLEKGKAELQMLSLTQFSVQGDIRGALTAVLRSHRMQSRGIDGGVIAELLQSADLDATSVVAKAGEEKADTKSTMMLSVVIIMIFYMTLLIYGLMIMNAIIEDKSSRVYEVMLSSVSARDIMMGKILGVGGAALTQYAVWGSTVLIARSVKNIEPLQKMNFEPGILLLLLALFFLGFLVYALLYAGVGSLCSTVQESQQLQWPIMMFLIIPMVVMMPLLQNPDGGLATALSLFPMTSPIVMPMRLTATSPGALQIGACLLLLVLAVVAAQWISARVFRIAIMTHGKRPPMKQVVQWIREAQG